MGEKGNIGHEKFTPKTDRIANMVKPMTYVTFLKSFLLNPSHIFLKSRGLRKVLVYRGERNVEIRLIFVN